MCDSTCGPTVPPPCVAVQVNGRPLVALPSKTVHTVSVELDRASREKYERWQEAGKPGPPAACSMLAPR